MFVVGISVTIYLSTSTLIKFIMPVLDYQDNIIWPRALVCYGVRHNTIRV